MSGRNNAQYAATTSRGARAPANSSRPKGRPNIPEAIRVPSGSMKLLENIQLDPVIQSSMGKMGAELILRVSSSSTVTMSLVRAGTTEVIGTIDDLQRMSGFRTFVNQQKKISSAAETLEPTLDRVLGGTIWYRSVGGNGRYLPPKLSMEAVAKDRELGKLAAMIESNTAQIEDSLADDEIGAKRTLLRWSDDILHVLAEICWGALSGQPKEKGFLEKALFDALVPNWAYRKLSGAKLPPYKLGTDASVVLFPDDPSKNITFSVKEFRHKPFMYAHGDILGDAHFVFNLLDDDALLRAVSGAPDQQAFDDPADPFVSRVMKARMIIPTHYKLLRRSFDAKAKGKIPNFLFKPDFSSPEKGIACLSYACAAVSDLTPINLADSIGTFWKFVLKDDDFTTSLRGATRAKNIFALIVEDWENQYPKLLAFKRGMSKEMKKAIRGHILRMLGASDGGAIKARVEETIPLEHGTIDGVPVFGIGNGFVQNVLPAPSAGRLEWRKLKNDKLHTDLQRDIAVALDLEAFTKKAPKKVSKTSLKLTPLGEDSKDLIKTIKEKKSLKFLAPEVDQWLRGFSSGIAQRAAAQIVYAQLDNIVSLDDDEEMESGQSGSESDEDD